MHGLISHQDGNILVTNTQVKSNTMPFPQKLLLVPCSHHNKSLESNRYSDFYNDNFLAFL